MMSDDDGCRDICMMMDDDRRWWWMIDDGWMVGYIFMMMDDGGWCGIFGLNDNGSWQVNLCQTPLHCAAMSGKTEVMQVLLDANADINARMVCNFWSFWTV